MPTWPPPTTSEGAIGGGAGRAGSVACAERAAWSSSPSSPSPPSGRFICSAPESPPRIPAPRAPCPTRPRRGRRRHRHRIGCPPARRGFAFARSRRSRPPFRMPRLRCSATAPTRSAASILAAAPPPPSRSFAARPSRPAGACPSRSTTRRRRRVGGGAWSSLEEVRSRATRALRRLTRRPGVCGSSAGCRRRCPTSRSRRWDGRRSQWAASPARRGRTELSRSAPGAPGGWPRFPSGFATRRWRLSATPS